VSVKIRSDVHNIIIFRGVVQRRWRRRQRTRGPEVFELKHKASAFRMNRSAAAAAPAPAEGSSLSVTVSRRRRAHHTHKNDGRRRMMASHASINMTNTDRTIGRLGILFHDNIYIIICILRPVFRSPRTMCIIIIIIIGKSIIIITDTQEFNLTNYSYTSPGWER